jgi:hypothetical protein
MDKFIQFKDGLINTKYIIAVAQSNRTDIPSYGIAVHITNDIIRQWFETEEERDMEFDNINQQLLQAID